MTAALSMALSLGLAAPAGADEPVPDETCEYVSEPGEEGGGTEPSDPGTGEEDPGTGEEDPGTGEEDPGTGEEDPGTKPDDPGSGEEDPGTGEEDPGTGEEDPGTKPDDPGTGEEDPAGEEQYCAMAGAVDDSGGAAESSGGPLSPTVAPRTVRRTVPVAKPAVAVRSTASFTG
jgi:hypothetical protein